MAMTEREMEQRQFRRLERDVPDVHENRQWYDSLANGISEDARRLKLALAIYDAVCEGYGRSRNAIEWDYRKALDELPEGAEKPTFGGYKAASDRTREEVDGRVRASEGRISALASEARARIQDAMAEPPSAKAQALMASWSGRKSISDDELEAAARAYGDNYATARAIDEAAERVGSEFRVGDSPARSLAGIGRAEAEALGIVRMVRTRDQLSDAAYRDAFRRIYRYLEGDGRPQTLADALFGPSGEAPTSAEAAGQMVGAWGGSEGGEADGQAQ